MSFLFGWKKDHRFSQLEVYDWSPWIQQGELFKTEENPGVDKSCEEDEIDSRVSVSASEQEQEPESVSGNLSDQITFYSPSVIWRP